MFLSLLSSFLLSFCFYLYLLSLVPSISVTLCPPVSGIPKKSGNMQQFLAFESTFQNVAVFKCSRYVPYNAGLSSCTVHCTMYNTLPYSNTGMYLPKDHIEKIDFQELIFAVVNWPNSELYGAFVCIMHYLDQSATTS